ncbi:homoserine O-acetyltransferase-like protein [Pyrenochaeta sp. MPI-SDFR-AT-0127]|nr:homoserine O-acetyltransferase-like protein [Pyrenochaeta sp. MPI-SDFR-AT-0127]
MQHFSIPNFAFKSGSILPQVQVAYKILNPQNKKIAIIHTCFRGRIDGTLTHATDSLKGHKIIVIALFGNGESSSPSNTPNFPSTIEYMDCVEAQYRLLTEELNVEEIDIMMGFSMGGQITYHWLVTHPSYIKNAVIVCSSAKTSRHNFQFLEGPRAALESADTPALGLRAFWFDQELYKELGVKSQSEWDDAAAGGNYDDWTADDLLALSGMWQRGDVARCVPDVDVDGRLEHALQMIKARVLLIPCETDQYFRPYVSEREAQSLQTAWVDILPSIWGHLAGSGASPRDTQWMNERIHTFLKG